MRFVAKILSVLSIIGVIARLVPTEFSTLLGLPIIVSFTPWFSLTALGALIMSALSSSRRSHKHTHRPALQRITIAALVVCLAFEASWELPFFTSFIPNIADPSKHVSSPETRDSAATDSSNSVNYASDNLQVSSTNKKSFRVMTCNVFKGHANPAALIDLIRNENVQVLALQETTGPFIEQLESCGLSELLPYAQRSSSDGVYGNGIWSALPLNDVASDDIHSSASAMPAATIHFDNAYPTLSANTSTDPVAVRFVSVHTCSPTIGHWDLWRTSISELGVVRDRVEHDSHTHYVMMGDFNATYDHAPFRDMLGTTLFDAAKSSGEGLTFTWSTATPMPPFCGIDHIVMSPGMQARDMQATVIPGTDHAALLGTLSIS